jgi:hypothetical protein
MEKALGRTRSSPSAPRLLPEPTHPLLNNFVVFLCLLGSVASSDEYIVSRRDVWAHSLTRGSSNSWIFGVCDETHERSVIREVWPENERARVVLALEGRLAGFVVSTSPNLIVTWTRSRPKNGSTDRSVHDKVRVYGHSPGGWVLKCQKSDMFNLLGDPEQSRVFYMGTQRGCRGTFVMSLNDLAQVRANASVGLAEMPSYLVRDNKSWILTLRDMKGQLAVVGLELEKGTSHVIVPDVLGFVSWREVVPDYRGGVYALGIGGKFPDGQLIHLTHNGAVPIGEAPKSSRLVSVSEDGSSALLDCGDSLVLFDLQHKTTVCRVDDEPGKGKYARRSVVWDDRDSAWVLRTDQTVSFITAAGGRPPTLKSWNTRQWGITGSDLRTEIKNERDGE